MLIMILASMLFSEPSAAKSDNGFRKVHAARIASQDVQQVAIDAITGKSPTSSSSRTAVAERSGTTDPQSEIVDRITAGIFNIRGQPRRVQRAWICSQRSYARSTAENDVPEDRRVCRSEADAAFHRRQAT